MKKLMNAIQMFRETGTILPISGGANPKGYNETADLILKTVDGVDIDTLYQEIIDSIGILNAQRSPLIQRLTFPVDSPFEQVMPLNSSDFEEADEYGQPVGIRLGRPWNMGYDLRYFDLAERFTWRWLARSTAAQVRALNNTALDADNRLVARTILNRIFDNTNAAVTLEATGTATTAYPFFNGDITALPAAPPDWKTYTFLTTHTHYGVSAGATVASADLDTMYEHIYHHGYAQGGTKFFLLVNRVQAKTIRTFRVATGSLYDFLPAIGDVQATFLGTLVGSLPGAPSGAPNVFPGFIGSWGPIDIIEEDYMPSGYMVMFASGGKFAQTNPVGLREHENPGLKGLKLIPTFDRYPLRESFYHHAVGAGIRHGAAGYVMKVTGSGGYTVPTIALGGQGGR